MYVNYIHKIYVLVSDEDNHLIGLFANLNDAYFYSKMLNFDTSIICQDLMCIDYEKSS